MMFSHVTQLLQRGLPCPHPPALACGLRPNIMAVQHLCPIMAVNAVQCRAVHS